ncbi:Kinesin-like protein KIN-13A [Camellia lanceoleosa]|uniref:Kinesin-like protein KIN-13A n=1 Tax=Camellia lanceoleosa TaxID=1840588 RepID=A0ACC0F0I4_9ERIC|nr:Kinesin-like protein KIN-13A [Camellia lanceoleosa]
MWLEPLLLLLLAGLILLLLLLLAGLMLLQCCCELCSGLSWAAVADMVMAVVAADDRALVRRDWISERMRKLQELVPNMDKGYVAQFAEEKQRHFKLIRNLNFIEESGSEPYTPTGQGMDVLGSCGKVVLAYGAKSDKTAIVFVESFGIHISIGNYSFTIVARNQGPLKIPSKFAYLHNFNCARSVPCRPITR